MKKGILRALAVCTLATVFAAPFALISANAADRTDAGLVPDFSDNFESYEVGNWIEETDGFALNWSNNVLDEGDELGMDSHLLERAKIEYENGTDGNKVLHLDNRVGGNSFFYIGPKGDYRYKNFNVSFRVKFLESGWISAVVRKDANVWYNGCNNLNATLFVAADESCLQVVPYRNMPGAADQQLKPTATLDLEGYTVTLNTYKNATNTYLNEWFEVRYEINERSYKMFVNDTLMMDLYYPARKLLDFGYVSLNGCTADVLFDDFEIENLDTEAPPALEEEEPEESSSTSSSEEPQKSPCEQPEDDNTSGDCNSTVSIAAIGMMTVAAGAVLCKKREDK